MVDCRVQVSVYVERQQGQKMKIKYVSLTDSRNSSSSSWRKSIIEKVVEGVI